MKELKSRKLHLNKKVVLHLNQTAGLWGGGQLIISTNAGCTNSTAPVCGISTGAPTCRSFVKP